MKFRRSALIALIVWRLKSFVERKSSTHAGRSVILIPSKSLSAEFLTPYGRKSDRT